MDDKVKTEGAKKPAAKSADGSRIILLSTPSCPSCVSARSFLTANNLPFEEINFFVDQIPEQVFKDILSLTENGIFDIISTRSRYLSSQKIDIEDLRMSELIELTHKQPTIVKRPIVLQYDASGLPKRLMIGFNQTDIKVFLRPLPQAGGAFAKRNPTPRSPK